MATNNAVNNSLSSQTGTGSFVGSISPSLTTPNIGVATATSLSFSPTTNGITGTTAADNASAGYVGGFYSSVIPSASAVSMTNNTVRNITSLSLPAGDYDVWGNVLYQNSTTNMTGAQGWISAISATTPDVSLIAAINDLPGSPNINGFCVPMIRINISSTTTVYLSGLTSFVSGTSTGCGGLYARVRR